MSRLVNQPVSYRLTDEQIREFLQEIGKRPIGRRVDLGPDLEAELRAIRVEQVYSVNTGTWRWAARLGQGFVVNRDGLRVWEASLKSQGIVDTTRFNERDEAEDVLMRYLDSL